MSASQKTKAKKEQVQEQEPELPSALPTYLPADKSCAKCHCGEVCGIYKGFMAVVEGFKGKCPVIPTNIAQVCSLYIDSGVADLKGIFAEDAAEIPPPNQMLPPTDEEDR